jgi:chorismate synthase
VTAAAPRQAVQVRELRGLSELALTLPLAGMIWGEGHAAEDPTLLHVLQHTGGLVAGAFGTDGELVAYLVGLPTRRPDVQHSHRLGVHPTARRQGLGECLKLFQRGWCLERGVTEVHWTFDPLLLANAHLNIHRLGGTVSTLLPDYYGPMTGINAGVPSDRFEVEWQLDSVRVQARLAGWVAEDWTGAETLHPLQDPLPAVLPDALAVQVPADYYCLIREEAGLALAWREKTRPVFTQLFSQGFALTDVNIGRQLYLFGRAPAC